MSARSVAQPRHARLSYTASTMVFHNSKTGRCYWNCAQRCLSAVRPTWTKLTHKSSCLSLVTIWRHLFPANRQTAATFSLSRFSPTGTAFSPAAQHGRNRTLFKCWCCCCCCCCRRSIDRTNRWLTTWQLGRWRQYYLRHHQRGIRIRGPF